MTLEVPTKIIIIIVGWSSCGKQSHEKYMNYTVEPVYNCHLWDHAKWLLYRGGLLIEVGGALGLH